MPSPIQLTSTKTFESKTITGIKFTLRKWSVKRRREHNEVMAPLLHRERLIQADEAEFWQAQTEANKEAAILPCKCGHMVTVDAGEVEHDGPCVVANCECRHGVLPGSMYVDHGERIEKVNSIVNNEMVPARLRWAVESIEGLEMDGAPVDVERLIELGPDNLSKEIYDEITAMLFPTDEEVKNSSSPITSTPQADGATKTGAVESAS